MKRKPRKLPRPGETITVEGKTYTFRHHATQPDEIQIEATASGTCRNINRILKSMGYVFRAR